MISYDNKGVKSSMFMGLECVCNLVDCFVVSHYVETFDVWV